MLKIISIVTVVIVLSMVFYFQAWFVTSFRERIGNFKFLIVCAIGILFLIITLIALNR